MLVRLVFHSRFRWIEVVDELDDSSSVIVPALPTTCLLGDESFGSWTECFSFADVMTVKVDHFYHSVS